MPIWRGSPSIFDETIEPERRRHSICQCGWSGFFPSRPMYPRSPPNRGCPGIDDVRAGRDARPEGRLRSALLRRARVPAMTEFRAALPNEEAVLVVIAANPTLPMTTQPKDARPRRRSLERAIRQQQRAPLRSPKVQRF